MPKYRRGRNNHNKNNHKNNRRAREEGLPSADEGRREPFQGADDRDQFDDEFDEFEDGLDEIEDDDLLDDDSSDLGSLRGHYDLGRIAETMGDEFEVVDLASDDFADLEELEDWAAGGASGSRAVSVDELLNNLIKEEGEPSLPDLMALSDLTRQQAELVRDRWALVPPSRRLRVVEQLVRLADEDLDLQLAQFLRVAMHDSEAEVRALAVRGLWEDEATDLIGSFIALLHNDPSTAVRAAAATGLAAYVLAGELEELDGALAMRAEEALLGVLHDESEPLEVRRRALESIAYSGEVGVRQLIEDAYYDSEEAMRISALFAMGRSADVRWRGLVRAELRNPSAAMRAEAAFACGELEARSAVEELITLLSDQVERVRLAAIFALGRIGGRDARDALEAVLLGENPQETAAAEEALEEMEFFADPEGAALFEESLDDEDEWDNDPFDRWDDFDDRDLGEYDDE